MTDWPVLLLIMEGIPFLAFVYYLEHKKKMYLLERETQNGPKRSRWTSGLRGDYPADFSSP